MAEYDPGDFDCDIGGVKQVDEFTGLTDWRRDKDISFNEGPGGRAFSFVHQRNNNKVTFTINVRQTSDDLQRLRELARDEDVVTIKAYLARNEDAYNDSEVVALGAKRCVIQEEGQGLGDGDPEDVSFSVMGIEAISQTKAELVQ